MSRRVISISFRAEGEEMIGGKEEREMAERFLIQWKKGEKIQRGCIAERLQIR